MPEPHDESARPEGLFPPQPPRTGDVDVDAALDDFVRDHEGDLDARADAGTRLRDALEHRLGDIGTR